MDEIALLVDQTYRHFQQRFPDSNVEDLTPIVGMREDWEFNLPSTPGLIYHVQLTNGLFVLRTLPSKNLRFDMSLINEKPEDYPSLRLIENGESKIFEKLKFFVVEDFCLAEVIHHQVNNRRFPINEESLCNISDPGFSWWYTKREGGFQISFNLSHNEDHDCLKMGPLGDQKVAIKQFEYFFNLIEHLELEIEFHSDFTKFSFFGNDDFILKELIDFFEFGLIGESLKHLFKLLAKGNKDHASLESLWYYFQELSAIRKFWIQIQKEIA